MLTPKPSAVLLLVTALVLISGCSKPEAKILGHWTGSAPLKMASTGNPQLDAQIAAHPQDIGCNLNLLEDKTYIENLQGYVIDGTWTFDDGTITMTPKTVNGRGIEAAKRQMVEAESKLNIKMDFPGMNGPEQATLASDGQSISVTAFNSTISLHRITDAGAS